MRDGRLSRIGGRGPYDGAVRARPAVLLFDALVALDRLDLALLHIVLFQPARAMLAGWLTGWQRPNKRIAMIGLLIPTNTRP